METITSSAGLKAAIQRLELEKSVNGQLLREQFSYTWTRFKPINLIRDSIHTITSSPNILEDILGATMGLVTGFVTKKIVVQGSGNILRKLLGSVLQVGVTTAVVQHSDAVKSAGQYIFKKVVNKIRKRQARKMPAE